MRCNNCEYSEEGRRCKLDMCEQRAILTKKYYENLENKARYKEEERLFREKQRLHQDENGR